MLCVGLSVRPIQSRHYIVWETSGEKVCLANSSLSFLPSITTPPLSTKNSNYLFLAVRPSLLGYRLLFVFCCQAPTSDLFPLVCFGILLYALPSVSKKIASAHPCVSVLGLFTKSFLSSFLRVH